MEIRKRVGEREGDTIVGKGFARVVTLVDCKSSLLRMRLVPNGEAHTVMRAIVHALYPLQARVHTLTWDNGSEFAEHALVDIALTAKRYFAEPYSSWQRGTNESTNGLIRQYLSVGNYHAYALHTNADYQRWNAQAQASHYGYDVDGGAERLVVGAYALHDSIPASADTYTFNVKYHQPVQWGPIHGLDFYNDYSLVTDKSGRLPNTFMNVLGVGVSAGDLYTYLDYLIACNQPFVGGSMAGDGEVEHRFNINFGFYF